MRLFHIATASDWAAARSAGRYTTSTRGRTLAEEGFVHLSRADQWQAVRTRWYADVTEPLVLLVIDPALLTAPVVDEPAVPGGGETFPHVYGPIDVEAVVQVVPLDAASATAPVAAPVAGTPGGADPGLSFGQVYLREMMLRVGLATLVMVSTVVGLLVGSPWGARSAAVTAVVVGLAALAAVTGYYRRRRSTQRTQRAALLAR